MSQSHYFLSVDIMLFLTQSQQVRGSNLFYYEIVSGTCSSHRLQNIEYREVCALAARKHGYNLPDQNRNDDPKNQHLHACMIHPWQDKYRYKDSNIIQHTAYHINMVQDELLCTAQTPCFCSSKYYVDHNPAQPQKRNTKVNGQFLVTWSLDLAGKEHLLESDFLRAGFEQSVKDYINNDILCSDDLSIKGAEFYGVEIESSIGQNKWKNRAVSGNGKCKGDIKKCKVPIKAKAKPKSDDDLFNDDDDDVGGSKHKSSKVAKATYRDEDFCDVFLSSTIFDAFEERLLTASFFNYDVDVSVINDLKGSLKLDYDVTFQPSKTDGLNQIEDVTLDAQEPVQINSTCAESQCLSQRDVMRKIFVYFGIPFDESKHECLYQGINCNSNDMVTHIWMGK